MTQARVSPTVIKWARGRRGMSEDQLAKSLQSSPQTVREWESGQQKPTFRQSQHVAQTLHIPFGYLYLKRPPEERLPLPDFRALSTSPDVGVNHDVLALVNSLTRKQEWYREFVRSQGGQPRHFVGSANGTDNAELVAGSIRETLQLTPAIRSSSSDWTEYLRTLTTLAERAGILVLRSGIVGNNTHRKLPIEQIRGLAFADDMAPLVFINSSDAKTAQIFTFAHELAHLWLGASGVSNLDATTELREIDQEIEILCNQIAAEVLVPAVEFHVDWRETSSESDQLQRLARAYWVSTEVILRRAYELGHIDRSEYFARLENQRRNQVAPTGEASGGSFQRNLYARNSSLLVNAVFESVLNGRTLYRV